MDGFLRSVIRLCGWMVCVVGCIMRMDRLLGRWVVRLRNQIVAVGLSVYDVDCGMAANLIAHQRLRLSDRRIITSSII